MSDDPEYFKEFLENPAAPDINEFYRMVRLWAKYVGDHKDEFNYLEDDEWKEIRERLIEEFQKREVVRQAIDAEWDELCEKSENGDQLSDDEKIENMKRHLAFMRTYQVYYQLKDEHLAEAEKKLANYVKAVDDEKTALENHRQSKIELEKSIADFDDELAKYQEKTGKVPVFPAFPDKKTYKGK